MVSFKVGIVDELNIHLRVIIKTTLGLLFLDLSKFNKTVDDK